MRGKGGLFCVHLINKYINRLTFIFNMSDGKQEGALILAILIGLYLLVQFFKFAFPIFVILTIICFIVTIILAITIGGEIPTIIAAVCFVILLVLSIIAYTIGFGIEKTEVGKGLVDAGGTLYDAKQQIEQSQQEAENAIKNATIEVVDSVGNLSEDTKPVADITKKLVEIS